MTCVCLNSSSFCFMYMVTSFSGPVGLTASVTSNITNLSTVVQWDVVDDSLTTINYTVTWSIENILIDSATLIE